MATLKVAINPIVFLLSVFSPISVSLWACANLVQAPVNLFPRVVSLLFNGLFVQNSLYLFHTRSTAEGFIYFRELSAAVEGGLEGKDWWCFHTVSHLRIATSLLYLFYQLFFIQLSLLFLLPFSCTFFIPPHHLSFFLFHIYLTSYKHRLLYRYKCVMCNFPLFLIIENLSGAPLDTFTNVSASQPLSSTHGDTKCQPLSSVTAFVNYSHLEMSMSRTTIRVSRFLEGWKHSTLQPTKKIYHRVSVTHQSETHRFRCNKPVTHINTQTGWKAYPFIQKVWPGE